MEAAEAAAALLAAKDLAAVVARRGLLGRGVRLRWRRESGEEAEGEGEASSGRWRLEGGEASERREARVLMAATWAALRGRFLDEGLPAPEGRGAAKNAAIDIAWRLNGRQ